MQQQCNGAAGNGGVGRGGDKTNSNSMGIGRLEPSARVSSFIHFSNQPFKLAKPHRHYLLESLTARLDLDMQYMVAHQRTILAIGVESPRGGGVIERGGPQCRHEPSCRCKGIESRAPVATTLHAHPSTQSTWKQRAWSNTPVALKSNCIAERTLPALC